MPTLTCEPRDAGAVDTQSVTELFDEITSTIHGPSACISTCSAGFTIVCDGSSFQQTCTNGFTIHCDT